ncbi:conserved protein of unknown function [[Clostridium] ultunense Esp]|uniref:Uncharacterized protein n=1 Tax=[Clostridium] ultunense Esp TaxID=1288971 RepID=A0A1M4PQA6_9FIRM|nr:conserved protein of unknown function [[Clostridium] ultunense Esp]
MERVDTLPYRIIMERASDRLMSMAELMEDHSFKKIPKDKIDYFIDESIKIGIETAINSMDKYKSLEEICEDKKIKVELDTTEYDFEMVKFRGKYKEEREKIIIYDGSIKRMEIAYRELGIRFLNYNNIYRILLAHELFHYMESKEIGNTYEKLDEVNVFRLGPIKKSYPIIKTSDIGANIFAKKFLNLSFNPKVLNYLYLWGTGIVDKNKLLDYYNELDERLKVYYLTNIEG